MKPSPYSPDYENLRLWMKEKRKEIGLTIRDVADILGRDHSIFAKLEQNRKRIEITEFVRYCQTIGADPMEGMSILIKSMDSQK